MLHPRRELLNAGGRVALGLWLLVPAGCAASGPQAPATRAGLPEANIEQLEWSRLHLVMKMRGEQRARLGSLSVEGIRWLAPMRREREGEGLRSSGSLSYELHGLGAVQRVQCELGAQQGIAKGRERAARFETEAWLRCAFASDAGPQQNLSVYFEAGAGERWSVVTRSAAPGWEVRRGRGERVFHSLGIGHEARGVAQLQLSGGRPRVALDRGLDEKRRALASTYLVALSLAAGPLEWASTPPGSGLDRD